MKLPRLIHEYDQVHSAVCGNGQCPREDTDIDANENGERGSPYFGDCRYGKVKS